MVRRGPATLEAGTFIACGALGPGALDLVVYGNQLSVPLARQKQVNTVTQQSTH